MGLTLSKYLSGTNQETPAQEMQEKEELLKKRVNKKYTGPAQSVAVAINEDQDKTDPLLIAVKQIWHRGLDFGWKSMLMLSVSLVGVSIASYFGNEPYKQWGDDGAHLIPGDKDLNDEMGGPSSYWANVALSIYFIMLTLMRANRFALECQMKRYNNLPLTLGKKTAKFALDFILAGIAAYPLAALAEGDSTIVLAMSLLVNTVQDFLGAQSMTSKLWRFLRWASKKLGCRHDQVQKSDQLFKEKHPDQLIRALLETWKKSPACVPGDILATDSSTNFYNYVINPVLSTISSSSRSTVEKFKEFAGNSPLYLTQAVFFVLNIFSLYGLYWDTVDDTAKAFGIEDNAPAKYTLGTLSFLPFYVLSIDILLDSAEAIHTLIKDIYTAKNKNPNLYWILLPKLLLIAGGYTIGYWSSATSLALNEKFASRGGKFLGELILTTKGKVAAALGAGIFNGVAIMEPINEGSLHIERRVLFTPAQRNVLKRTEQTEVFTKHNREIEHKMSSFSSSIG